MTHNRPVRPTGAQDLTTIWKAAAGWVAESSWPDLAHPGAGNALLYNNPQPSCRLLLCEVLPAALLFEKNSHFPIQAPSLLCVRDLTSRIVKTPCWCFEWLILLRCNMARHAYACYSLGDNLEPGCMPEWPEVLCESACAHCDQQIMGSLKLGAWSIPLRVYTCNTICTPLT